MQISMKLRGHKEFSNKLKEIHRSLDKTRPLYKSLGIEVLKRIIRHYDEGGPRHDRWVPLAASTVAGRRRGSSKPLVDTRLLLQNQWDYDDEPTRVTIGHPSDIAVYHERGTRPYTIVPRRAKFLRFRTEDGIRYAKKVNHPGLPRRRQLPLSHEIMPELMKTLDVWLEKAVK